MISVGRPWVSHPGTNGASIALHGAEFHDNIFQDLVQRMPEMDVAVAERRPIVQDEALAPLRALLRAAVEIQRLATSARSPVPAAANSARIGKAVFGRFTVCA